MPISAAKPKPDPSELAAFPKGWKVPEFEIDRPGREYTAEAFHLLVSCNTTDPEPAPWHASIFYRGDVDAVWTKGGFPSATEARHACVNQALRMLRETKDAIARADER
jgi:hypothetical protein